MRFESERNEERFEDKRSLSIFVEIDAGLQCNVLTGLVHSASNLAQAQRFCKDLVCFICSLCLVSQTAGNGPHEFSLGNLD